MTVLLNVIAGQFVAWLNKLGPQAGINAAVILQNRGEFALILATLSISAGLDSRIVPFAGLYVLVLSIIGPVLAVNSEKIGAVILRTNKKKAAAKLSTIMAEENIALVEAATVGLDAGDPEHAVTAADRLIEQAMLQSDAQTERTRDPEY
jgi:CPA2 family monovalent cation:H+ antiporter-2